MKRKLKYIEYDLDKTFETEMDRANENEIMSLLEKGKIKCVYATKTIISGDQVEIEIFPEFTRKQIKSDNSIRKKKKEVQKNLNDRNARKTLERLINTNFGDGDIWATLTYEKEPESTEVAQKNIQNYIRRLKRKAKNIELKYIYITEHSKKNKIRYHHHMIINGEIGMDLVESTWNLGRRNNTRRTKKDSKGLTGLSEYLTKNPNGSKRWCSSKNLKQPTIRKNHQDFKRKHIRQMTENRNIIRELIEKKYKNMIYIDETAKYNEHNHFTYFYVRLSTKERKPKRE